MLVPLKCDQPMGHWTPERLPIPRSGWSQDLWGNYIADLYAGGNPSTPPPPPLFRRSRTTLLDVRPSAPLTGIYPQIC